MQVANVLARNCRAAGVQGPPTSLKGSIMWNVEIPYLRPLGRQTVRHAVGGAGVTRGKKQMPPCNWADTRQWEIGKWHLVKQHCDRLTAATVAHRGWGKGSENPETKVAATEYAERQSDRSDG